jgi:phosphopantothenoylcysteine decarboxylase/phosphopantothenate--cysteine ligase
MAKILVGVSGSIAAYKAADLVSELVKRGHQIQCVLTESARQFVQPLVLETLSGRRVPTGLFGEDVSGTEHIALARWPDLVVLAPATANLLANASLGLANDLLTTILLATAAPLLIAPAMNTQMWLHEATRDHVATLRRRGATIVEPADGRLACGETGPGKLASPEAILEAIEVALSGGAARDLVGRSILITAGPTIAPIDAVRYITNHSTGRMGVALAEVAIRRGARVHLVLGIDKGVVRPDPAVLASDCFSLVEVRTAEEMAMAALSVLPRVDGVVATAAVMDYRVEHPHAGKLKRSLEPQQVTLVPSADVLGMLKAQAATQWFLGFAAETDDIEANGRLKLAAKGLDYVFVNQVARDGQSRDTGFSVATNGGFLLGRDGTEIPLPVQSKADLAHKLLDLVARPRAAPDSGAVASLNA